MTDWKIQLECQVGHAVAGFLDESLAVDALAGLAGQQHGVGQQRHLGAEDGLDMVRLRATG